VQVALPAWRTRRFEIRANRPLKKCVKEC